MSTHTIPRKLQTGDKISINRIKLQNELTQEESQALNYMTIKSNTVYCDGSKRIELFLNRSRKHVYKIIRSLEQKNYIRINTLHQGSRRINLITIDKSANGRNT